jgi:hypothetical protein
MSTQESNTKSKREYQNEIAALAEECRVLAASVTAHKARVADLEEAAEDRRRLHNLEVRRLGEEIDRLRNTDDSALGPTQHPKST